MQPIIRYIICFIEVVFSIFMRKMGRHKDTSVIPSGRYCYIPDGTQGVYQNGVSWTGIKTCKYYRYIDGNKSACTFTGFIGSDPYHGYQVKICNKNNKSKHSLWNYMY